MKNQFYLMVLIFVLFFSLPGFTSVNETLPTWHWAYQYIEAMQERGFMLELISTNKPYSRGQVARQIMNLQVEDIQLSLILKNMIEKLKEEFVVEISEFSDKKIAPLKTGIRLQQDVTNIGNNDSKTYGMYRSKIAVNLGSHVTLYNGLYFNQYLGDDTLYTGKKWRDLVTYNEQAYISVNFKKLGFKIGRDFLEWGNGVNGALLFSNVCQPLDQILFWFEYGPLRFTYFTAQLDWMDYSHPDSADFVGNGARRFISAHRLDASFFSNKLQFSISEGLLYSGLYRQWDLVYINPVTAYYGSQINRKDNANMFGTFDVLVRPVYGWEIYGSLLIDDIQVEKTGPGDLEPNEIGIITGFKIADPFNWQGITLSSEYVKVTNRTYKTPQPYEILTYRNQPLGHPLGNDFDLIQAGVSKWFGADLWVRLQYEHVRKGEGSIYTPWDAPWFDYTVEEGYSEPFPTGVVEKRDHIRFEFRYQPSIHWGLQGEAVSSLYGNYQHVAGAEESFFEWRVGVWWDGEVFLMW